MPTWLVGVFYASLICSTLAQQPAPEEAAIRQALASSFAAPSPESELAASLTLAQLCGVPYTPFPSAELAATVGNVQRVNTTNSEIAYLRFGNTTSSRPPIVYISGFGSTTGVKDLAPIPTPMSQLLSKAWPMTLLSLSAL